MSYAESELIPEMEVYESLYRLEANHIAICRFTDLHQEQLKIDDITPDTSDRYVSCAYMGDGSVQSMFRLSYDGQEFLFVLGSPEWPTLNRYFDVDLTVLNLSYDDAGKIKGQKTAIPDENILLVLKHGVPVKSSYIQLS